MPDLPRLKPDPIPAINPVPEYAAQSDLADVYERTKAGLGVPWMGVVAMAFAHYRRFYECLWNAMEPMVSGAAFANACSDLRSCAEREAAALEPPTIRPRLRTLGYDEAELYDIRACNEIFSAGNMPYLLMASLARLLLEGHEWRSDVISDAPVIARRGQQKPTLIEAHHADPTIASLYADIRATLGLPFVNTDYRAFARWPSYFVPAWTDLKKAISGPNYERRVARVHDRAVHLAASLPNNTRVTARELRAAADADATADEVLSVVRLFQWLLPGLAVNVGFLRGQLVDEKV
ncbi:hypothetical protein HPQ64_15680 [Rhizobiales bacterium]|uniref:hypothetical protein n=1 Tax=Hongsoonwoonella zoysiae TaxID=2821844 RepID=UPI0015608A21|nr:hypothetical protein [Hongsoonwoonella zoysiae]NRG19132.1 hypothetical protein [Hongsoonwoonella zoysiae]